MAGNEEFHAEWQFEIAMLRKERAFRDDTKIGAVVILLLGIVGLGSFVFDSFLSARQSLLTVSGFLILIGGGWLLAIRSHLDASRRREEELEQRLRGSRA